MRTSNIDWCDYTWNPITGCRRGCAYCYADTMCRRFAGNIMLNKNRKDEYHVMHNGSAKLYVLDSEMVGAEGKAIVYPFGFEPTLHRYRFRRLSEIKTGSRVFVGAMADCFGPWIPDEWIEEVMKECDKYPQHHFIFLTKYPRRYEELQRAGKLPVRDNFWYGTTITMQGEHYFTSSKHNTLLSIEPILEQIEFTEKVKDVGWIIIGAETGRRKNKVIPDKIWIDGIAATADQHNIPVFYKNSLVPIVGIENMRNAFPEEMTVRQMSDKLLQKNYAECGNCKKTLPKGKMVTLLARFERGKQAKQYGFLCRECFEKHCQEYDFMCKES